VSNIALFDHEPSFCPDCGRPIELSRLGRQDYADGCPFGCEHCGLSYQLAKRGPMLTAAKASGGDLHHCEEEVT